MNRVTIEPTTFVNRSGEKSFGFRIFDDFAQAYDNTWDSLPEDDMEVLRKVLHSSDDAIIDLVNWVEIEKSGISIGEKYYSREKISKVFQKFAEEV